MLVSIVFVWATGGSVREVKPIHSAVVIFKSGFRIVLKNSPIYAPNMPGTGTNLFQLNGN